MSFQSQLDAFNAKQKRLAHAVFVNVVAATGDSIQFGSAVTGAPGQPVDTGHLRASFQRVFEGATRASIVTNAAYAEDIEHGTRKGRALTLRSEVGGFHSIQKTIQGFGKIVEAEAVKLGAT
jgi:hypothetical protein